MGSFSPSFEQVRSLFTPEVSRRKTHEALDLAQKKCIVIIVVMVHNNSNYSNTGTNSNDGSYSSNSNNRILPCIFAGHSHWVPGAFAAHFTGQIVCMAKIPCGLKKIEGIL